MRIALLAAVLAVGCTTVPATYTPVSRHDSELATRSWDAESETPNELPVRAAAESISAAHSAPGDSGAVPDATRSLGSAPEPVATRFAQARREPSTSRELTPRQYNQVATTCRYIAAREAWTAPTTQAKPRFQDRYRGCMRAEGLDSEL